MQDRAFASNPHAGSACTSTMATEGQHPTRDAAAAADSVGTMRETPPSVTPALGVLSEVARAAARPPALAYERNESAAGASQGSAKRPRPAHVPGDTESCDAVPAKRGRKVEDASPEQAPSTPPTAAAGLQHGPHVALQLCVSEGDVSRLQAASGTCLSITFADHGFRGRRARGLATVTSPQGGTLQQEFFYVPRPLREHPGRWSEWDLLGWLNARDDCAVDGCAVGDGTGEGAAASALCLSVRVPMSWFALVRDAASNPLDMSWFPAMNTVLYLWQRQHASPVSCGAANTSATATLGHVAAESNSDADVGGGIGDMDVSELYSKLRSQCSVQVPCPTAYVVRRCRYGCRRAHLWA